MNNPQQSIEINSLNNHEILAFCSGADSYTRHNLAPIVFSSGVITAVDFAEAYWFLDVIASYYKTLKTVHKDEYFFSISITKGTLKFNTETGDYDVDETVDPASKHYNFVIDDGNYNQLIHQVIPFTDFEFDTFRVYFCDNTVYLPSEH